MSLIKKVSVVLLLVGIFLLVLILKNQPSISGGSKENTKLVARASSDREAILFIDWYKKSGLCQINSLDLPASWNEKEKILNLDDINKIISQLNSQNFLSAELQSSIKSNLEIHKQVNSGTLWEAPNAEDELADWDQKHPGQDPPNDLGKTHWPDGFDDVSIGFLRMIHQVSCFEKIASSKTLNTSDTVREFQFQIIGENNKSYLQTFTQLKNSQTGKWEFDSYDIKL